MNDIYIVSGSRTPMGAFQGSLSTMSAVDLGAAAISETINRAGIAPDSVDEVIMGNVLSAGLRQGPARQAAMDAGIPVGIGATTINKLCGSGMKATMLSHDLIAAGTNDVMVAGGMESMTNAPYLIAKARGGMRMGHGEIQDSCSLMVLKMRNLADPWVNLLRRWQTSINSLVRTWTTMRSRH